MQVTDELMNTAMQHQSEPFVIVVGDFSHPDQCFLVVDRKIVSEIQADDIPAYLMAAFYVLNICYPEGCNNVYTFFEIGLLELKEPIISVTLSVKNFLGRLSCIEV